MPRPSHFSSKNDDQQITRNKNKNILYKNILYSWPRSLLFLYFIVTDNFFIAGPVSNLVFLQTLRGPR